MYVYVHVHLFGGEVLFKETCHKGIQDKVSILYYILMFMLIGFGLQSVSFPAVGNKKHVDGLDVNAQWGVTKFIAKTQICWPTYFLWTYFVPLVNEVLDWKKTFFLNNNFFPTWIL